MNDNKMISYGNPSKVFLLLCKDGREEGLRIAHLLHIAEMGSQQFLHLIDGEG